MKSLTPDGTPCTGTTQGLLRRANLNAGRLIPAGKETDRSWEQGEDLSMIDPSIHLYETPRKMCVADPPDRNRWSEIGVRKLMRKSGFSQKTVYKILNGKPVRCYVLPGFRQVADKITG